MAPFAQKTIPAHLKDPSYMAGRPTEYRPEYCEAVQAYMGQGYSLTAFAGSIRVARDTVYNWVKLYREFSDAVARARGARVAALEIKLLKSRKGAETSAAIFALKNADPTEWRDLKHTEHSHTLSVETLTDAQLLAIASGVSPGDAGVIEGHAERLSEKPATP
jgi:transposase-like protein